VQFHTQHKSQHNNSNYFVIFTLFPCFNAHHADLYSFLHCAVHRCKIHQPQWTPNSRNHSNSGALNTCQALPLHSVNVFVMNLILFSFHTGQEMSRQYFFQFSFRQWNGYFRNNLLPIILHDTKKLRKSYN
jgi:hypothetical protein